MIPALKFPSSRIAAGPVPVASGTHPGGETRTGTAIPDRRPVKPSRVTGSSSRMPGGALLPGEYAEAYDGRCRNMISSRNAAHRILIQRNPGLFPSARGGTGVILPDLSSFSRDPVRKTPCSRYLHDTQCNLYLTSGTPLSFAIFKNKRNSAMRSQGCRRACCTWPVFFLRDIPVKERCRVITTLASRSPLSIPCPVHTTPR